ncbi:helix-turn-helix domain-containing protein [Peribacillus loiseleuriae]|uniref:response regulator transcription factor n=1 Tax=Peribacillus loiseleuriae TaxID=1679170 RepID=UPI0038248003
MLICKGESAISITIKILIIDDEPIVRKGISYLLSHTELDDVRFEIVESDGSLIANQLLNEQEFNIVFTDIKMPGMDGLTLIDKWRRKLPETQWVILSGYDNFHYAQKAITLGVKEYILKPITKKNVQETLECLIDNYRKPSGNYLSMNELEEIIIKLEAAVWTLNKEMVTTSILHWSEKVMNKEIDVSYFFNTVHNLLQILIQRLNNRGSILLEDRVDSLTGNNVGVLIESFQQACIELIEWIRIQRKGQVLDPIEFAKAYILENLTKKISLDDVAKRLGLNSAYFSHLFKKETGTTFVEYRMKLRMEKAMKLIDAGNMKITEIANSLGYEDLPHFTRTFKKYTGLSPSKYLSALEIN